MASKPANKNRKTHHPFQRTLVSALVTGASLASAQVTISPLTNPVGGTVNVSTNTTTGATGFENQGTTNVLTNGILTNTGAGVPLKNQANAAINVQGNGYLENFNGAILSNQGALNVSNVPAYSGTNFGLDNFGAGTQLINKAGGKLTSTGANFTSPAMMVGASITNRNGAVIVNTDAGTVLSNQSGSILANSATLINQSGAVLENKGTNSSGDRAVIDTRGGTITNTGTGSTVNNGSGTATSGYDAELRAGFITNNGGATLNNLAGGLISQTSGYLTNTGAGTSLNNLKGAALEVTANAVVTTSVGAQLVNEGLIHLKNSFGTTSSSIGLVSSGTGKVFNQAGGQIISTGANFVSPTSMVGPSIGVYAGGALINSGAGTMLSNQFGSLLVMNGSTSVVSTLVNQNGALLENKGTNTTLTNTTPIVDLATMDIGTNARLTNTGVGSTFNNGTGTVGTTPDSQVRISGYGSTVSNEGGASLNNQAGGLIQVGSSAGGSSFLYNSGFDVNGSTITNSTLTNQKGGLIEVALEAGSLQNFNRGKLINEGTLRVSGSTLGFIGASTGLDNYGAGTQLVNQNGGQIVSSRSTVPGTALGANITNRDGASIINTGAGSLLSNQNGSILSMSGATSVSTLTNQSGAVLENGGKNQFGSLATVDLGSNARLTNTGVGSNVNNGTGTTSTGFDAQLSIFGGVVANEAGASLNNRAGGLIQVGSSGVSGFLYNSGFGVGVNGSTVINSTLTNQKGGVIDVAIEGGSLQNFNQGKLVNEGVLMVRSNNGFARQSTGLDNFGAGTQLINQNGGQIISSQFSALAGPAGGANITNRDGASIINTGAGSLLSNQNGSVVYMVGSSSISTLTNQGGATLENWGMGGSNSARATMDIGSNARLTNTGVGSTFNNGTSTTTSGIWDAQVRLYGGVVSNEGGASLNNRAGGLIQVGSSSGVSGFLYNSGFGVGVNGSTVVNSTLTNQKGGLIDVAMEGGSLQNFNQGKLVNEGVLMVRSNNGHAGQSTGLDNFGAGTQLINQNGGQIISSQFSALAGPTGNANITNRDGASIINTGAGSLLSNQNGSVVYMVGSSSISTLTNQGGATLENWGMGGGNVARATMDIGSNARLTNTGVGSTFNNGTSTTTSGIWDAQVRLYGGAVSNEGGASLNNRAGGLIQAGNYAGGTGFLYNSGIDANGTRSTLTNQRGGVIDVAMEGGSLQNFNQGKLVNEGLLMVRSNFGRTNALAGLDNFGAGTQLINQNGGQIISSQFSALAGPTGNANITNRDGASIINTGAGSLLSNQGGSVVYMYGTNGGATTLLRNEAGATLENKGMNGSGTRGTSIYVNGGSRLENSGTGTTLNNSDGGRIVVVSGGSLANESGAVLNNAASIENNGQMSNSGVFTVTATGAVSGVGRYVQTVGLTQSNGSWTQGLTDIQGGTLSGTGAINGGVHNDGTIQGTGSGLTLTGAVTGAGSYQGMVAFTGSFGPGNSPALVTADHLIFGTSNRLNMELGGLGRGTQYDAINANRIDLAGQLSLAFLNLGNGLFSAHAGDFFDILQGDLIGDFTSFDYGLAQLGGGLYWTHQFMQLGNGLEAYRLLVAQAPTDGTVPEPATLVLFVLGLAMMAHRARFRVRKE